MAKKKEDKTKAGVKAEEAKAEFTQEVLKICEMLSDNGIKPTARNIRQITGTGSYTTLTAIITYWQQLDEAVLEQVRTPHPITDMLCKQVQAAIFEEVSQMEETINGLKQVNEDLKQENTILRQALRTAQNQVTGQAAIEPPVIGDGK